LHHAGSAIHGANPVHIKPGARIAQLLLVPFVVAEFEVVDSLDESDRGANGWGSSGVA
jgi:dUTP pyrophosphatase